MPRELCEVGHRQFYCNTEKQKKLLSIFDTNENVVCE